MRPPTATSAAGPVQRLEEAFHLLRRIPRTALADYYIGTLPFVVALLYFLQDMSLHTLAYRRVAAGAMVLAALFGWMRVWQARFSGAMAAFQAGLEPPPADRATLLRQGAHQIIAQSAALVLLFLAALAAGILAPNGRAHENALVVVIVCASALLFFEVVALSCRWRMFLPIAGTMSFFQHIAILADGRRTLRDAVVQSARLSRHGHGTSASLPILALLAGLLLVNLGILLWIAPALLQQTLGVGTSLSRGGSAGVNSTLLGVALAMTFLAVDPLNRALHVLTCFYETAERSGQDLRGRFQRARSADVPGGVSAVAMVLAALLALSVPLAAGAQNPAAGAGLQDLASQLDQSIDQTLSGGQYPWRPELDNPNAGVLESIANTLNRWGSNLRDWLRSKDTSTPPSRNTGGGGGGGGGYTGPNVGSINLPPGEAIGGGLVVLLYGLLVLLIVGLAVVVVLFIRHHVRSREKEDEGDDSPETIDAKPDLSRDDTTADQLPEEGWLGLAAELLAKRQYRLALRAMYLACLAGLAERELVKIARSKSNHEYVVELSRRSHAMPGLMEPFTENVVAFEQAWYGMHTVTEAAVHRFRDNQQRMYRLSARSA